MDIFWMVFWWAEETGAPQGNTHEHGENTQAKDREAEDEIRVTQETRWTDRPTGGGGGTHGLVWLKMNMEP